MNFVSRHTCLRAAFFALLFLATSGCMTRKVWSDGKIREQWPRFESVRVSPTSEICILYEVIQEKSHRPWGGIQVLDVQPTWKPVIGRSYRRCLLIPAEAVATLPRHEADADKQAVPPNLQQCVLPRNVRQRAPDRRAIESTAEWTVVPMICEMTAFGNDPKYRNRPWNEAKALANEFNRQQQELVMTARQEGKATWQRSVGHWEIPIPNGERVLVDLPMRAAGFAGWSYPLRVTLTPLALAGDIITAPLQLGYCAIAFVGSLQAM